MVTSISGRLMMIRRGGDWLKQSPTPLFLEQSYVTAQIGCLIYSVINKKLCLFKTIDIKTPYTIDCTNLRVFCQEW